MSPTLGRGEESTSPPRLWTPLALPATEHGPPSRPGLPTVQTLPTSSLLPGQGRVGRGESCSTVCPRMRGKIQPCLQHPWWSFICIWELG